jgi:hypothetical protein
MKSLLIVVLLAGVAYADKFPASGPCDDLDACEQACAKNAKGTCYWGGVLALQRAVDDTAQARALAMFDKACSKGDGDACFQSANLVWQKGDDAKTRAAFQKACTKNHARACIRLGDIAAAAADAKSQKLATTSRAKGMTLLEQRCTKAKMVSACSWVASLYETAEYGKFNPKKAAAMRDKRCVIETGKVCPPPTEDAPSFSKPATRKRPD